MVHFYKVCIFASYITFKCHLLKLKKTVSHGKLMAAQDGGIYFHIFNINRVFFMG